MFLDVLGDLLNLGSEIDEEWAPNCRGLFTICFPNRISSLNTVEVSRTNLLYREGSGSVVECLTRDLGAASSSLTSVTALWSLSKYWFTPGRPVPV